MSAIASDYSSEEELSLFRPFTRESLAVIETRIAEEYAKQKELEKKRAEGEVLSQFVISHQSFSLTYRNFGQNQKLNTVHQKGEFWPDSKSVTDIHLPYISLCCVYICFVFSQDSYVCKTVLECMILCYIVNSKSYQSNLNEARKR